MHFLCNGLILVKKTAGSNFQPSGNIFSEEVSLVWRAEVMFNVLNEGHLYARKISLRWNSAERKTWEWITRRGFFTHQSVKMVFSRKDKLRHRCLAKDTQAIISLFSYVGERWCSFLLRKNFLSLLAIGMNNNLRAGHFGPKKKNVMHSYFISENVIVS